mmetsp:Transcript_2544/g.4894  ORF Transcript_2544/g.4894 Transcript_2544/m.4894 type:complete len:83 (+) Transcript_2544:493-741(+)
MRCLCGMGRGMLGKRFSLDLVFRLDEVNCHRYGTNDRQDYRSRNEKENHLSCKRYQFNRNNAIILLLHHQHYELSMKVESLD